ncbi:UDP-N-acetylmuramoyl-L-alanine--D-glutamate ligase [Hyphobacterium sp. SN044]|uniref:UDP-N-acetylmuramoyl-L-alanine--D-glutamate ligase n=1 Tax=Hyphobacterium sp. SN044 TaxID=2912575 RepID=UPI001F01367A|nr:UDP-N-acetylmuramoyl-L-alanine--D-glutamate ligase [Hyphobacterium sp. SN044]MCF8878366.1 UDP-N-acetylmuramoyl-L-alanine--D-glutamate ligase [Hyphobacterium sp. SN044]
MIPVREFEGRSVAVFGLGRTGIAAAKALAAGGANVLAWDDNADTRENAKKAGIELEDLGRRDWGDIAALVLSPGVPLTHPAPHRMVEFARTVGAEVIGDMELFARTINALSEADRPQIVGITGTNGKSTTTALIGHILKKAGREAHVGGNIGDAVLGLPAPRPGSVYVLELSSYQLDLVSSLKLDVSVFLNLTPDHIDRHGGMAGYLAAKKRIFLNQNATGTAVIGVDDDYTRGVCSGLMSGGPMTVVPVSSGRALSKGMYALGGKIYDATNGHTETVADLAQAKALPGRHNAQNAAAAFAAVRALGVDARTAAQAMKSFPGLPHRAERVGERDGILFVNDSKATNADSAAQALGCWDTIYWIAGGQQKEGGIEPLRAFFPRIAKAYLIGEAQDAFARTLGNEVAYEKAGTLENALDLALRDASEGGRKNPVILLSPACASFDQFKSYEHRGDVFRALVKNRLNGPERGAA